MTPDPNFPNRPTHPDFDLICQEAQANDNLSELGSPMFEAIVGNFVDLESISYVAVNRAIASLALAGRPATAENISLVAGGLLEGFALGAAVERRRHTNSTGD